MKKLVLMSLLLFACSPKENKEAVVEKNADVVSETQFGAKPSLEGDAITLVSAIDNKMLDKAIKLKSYVTEVCSKKGCWMTLSEGETSIRVTFKDYAFFVPLDFKDVNVELEGVLSKKLLTEDERRHFAEDQGASKEDIEKIKGDEYEFTFEATSVTKV